MMTPRPPLLALALMCVVAPLAQAQEPAEAPATEQPAAAPAPAEQPAPAPAEAGLDQALQPGAAPASGEISEEDLKQFSYLVGYELGRQYGGFGLQINTDEFTQGIQAGLAKEKPRFSEEQAQRVVMVIQQAIAAKQAAKSQEQAAKGDAYLAENKAKEGVKTTESGLQYQVLAEGEGESPKPEDTVRVHYRGTLIDGTQFDSSYDRGEPAEFPVGGVIPGWTEALQLMKPGAKYKLTIPSDLAYGEQPPPGIPPNSVLLFDVELLEVKK